MWATMLSSSQAPILSPPSSGASSTTVRDGNGFWYGYPMPTRVSILTVALQHWSAIFSGGACVFCFFLMEETNYKRAVVLDSVSNLDHVDKATPAKPSSSDNVSKIESYTAPPAVVHRPISYWQKLRIVRSQDVRNDVSIVGGLIRPFVYFRLPIVVFSGFMYGAVICYFGVLNGTASVLLSSPPYNFRPSIVGVSYISALIGVFIG